VALGEVLEPRWLLFGGVDRLINNNNGASTTGLFTQSETSIVAYGNTVIASYNDSGSNAVGAGDGGGSAGFTGWSRSTDGGNTWTDFGSLPEGNGGHAGDPAFARDELTGRVYLATLGFSVSTIRIYRSDDDGQTWLTSVTGTPGGASEDKEWLAVDNFAGTGRGNVYLMSRRFAGTTGLYFYRSTDQGGTFGNGVLLSAGANGPQGAFVTVGSDHSIYAIWFQGNNIVMRKSTDLGLTFGAQTTVAASLGGGTNGDLALTGLRNGLASFSAFRSNGFPHVAVNPVNGNLYVVYNNNPAGTDKADIQLVQSTNGGASWSVPVRVNDDATLTDQWQPTLAITPDGTKLGVFYSSRQEDASNNLFKYYGRIATLSGATTTFGASEPISDVASIPEFGRDSLIVATYMGDYNFAAATNDAFHVVWSDNRSPHPMPGAAPRMDPNVYYDKIPLSAPPAPNVTASSFVFATAPQRLTFTFDQNVGASLDLGDIQVQRLPGGPFVNPTGLSYNAVTNTATFSFTGILPDDDYRATLIAGGITNAGGTPLPANVTQDFFFLQGDATHDGRVNLDDFNRLAANFGQSPRDFTQGDFNYDNVVNLDDFNILAARFGNVLAGPAAQPGFVPGSGKAGSTGTRKLMGELLE